MTATVVIHFIWATFTYKHKEKTNYIDLILNKNKHKTLDERGDDFM